MNDEKYIHLIKIIDRMVINVGYIDTAMIIIPFSWCKNIKWKLDIYEADDYYITESIDNNRYNHVHIDEDLCYYNI